MHVTVKSYTDWLVSSVVFRSEGNCKGQQVGYIKSHQENSIWQVGGSIIGKSYNTFIKRKRIKSD